ncbi:Fic family protein, partial [uncultured Cardiobacterium sp.]|uniref:Fic family protein n=1 Tax=uncultured Cardiobacterium sp. TaxID=417619 RepID=UPI0034516A78
PRRCSITLRHLPSDFSISITDLFEAAYILGHHQPLSVVELLDKLSIRHRASFRTTYLVPALTQNLVEMTLPDKPKSPNQKYRLTAKGRALLQRTKAPR